MPAEQVAQTSAAPPAQNLLRPMTNDRGGAAKSEHIYLPVLPNFQKFRNMHVNLVDLVKDSKAFTRVFSI